MSLRQQSPSVFQNPRISLQCRVYISVSQSGIAVCAYVCDGRMSSIPCLFMGGDNIDDYRVSMLEVLAVTGY